MCSATSFGNNTLFCNVGSMCFPPEWPCVARKYRHVSGELGSTQYWNLFLTPPPLCKKLGHIRIDQCEEDVVIMSLQSDHQCRYFQTTFVESSWFYVGPFSSHDTALESSQKIPSNLVTVSILFSERLFPYSH